MTSNKPKKKISLALAALIVVAAVVATYFIVSYSDKVYQLDCAEMNIFYSDRINLDEAVRFRNYILKSAPDLNPKDKKNIKLDKEGSEYVVKFVIKRGDEMNDAYVDMFKLFAHQLSKDVFEGKPVRIDLCDTGFDTILKIEEYDIK